MRIQRRFGFYSQAVLLATPVSHIKNWILLLVVILSAPVSAQCDWTEERAIPNLKEWRVAQCSSENKLKFNGEFEKSVNFSLESSVGCPECNFVWAIESADKRYVFVYVKNAKYQTNGWLFDAKSGKTLLFIDNSRPKARHFKPEFVAHSKLRITHAGVGYKVDDVYEKTGDNWLKIN